MIGEAEIIGGHGVGKRRAAREAYLMSIVADLRVCLFVCSRDRKGERVALWGVETASGKSEEEVRQNWITGCGGMQRGEGADDMRRSGWGPWWC